MAEQFDVTGVSRIGLPDPVSGPPRAGPTASTTNSPSFDQILSDQVGDAQGLRFSAHAKQRLQTRSIALNGGDIERIQHAVDQASQKGAKESLILMDDLAFLVSVKNRTVITAIDNASATGSVFTNIDSVVIVKDGRK